MQRQHHNDSSHEGPDRKRLKRMHSPSTNTQEKKKEETNVAENIFISHDHPVTPAQTPPQLLDCIPGMVFVLVVGGDGPFSQPRAQQQQSQQNQPRWKFLYVSKYCETIFGLAPDQVISNSDALLSLILPSDRDSFQESLLQSILSLKIWDWTGRIQRHGVTSSRKDDGEICNIRTVHFTSTLCPIRRVSSSSSSGQTIEWQGVVFDRTLPDIIGRSGHCTSNVTGASVGTEQKRQQLTHSPPSSQPSLPPTNPQTESISTNSREHNCELGVLLDCAPHPIISLDTGGAVTEWNGTSERITGYSRKEVIGKNFVSNFVVEACQGDVLRVLDDVILHGDERNGVVGGEERQGGERMKSDEGKTPTTKPSTEKIAPNNDRSCEVTLQTKSNKPLHLLLTISTKRSPQLSTISSSSTTQPPLAITGAVVIAQHTISLSSRLALAHHRSDAEKGITEWLSHEVRNPLSVAMEASRTLKEDPSDDPEENSNNLELICLSLGYIVELLTDMLDLNKCIEGKITMHPSVCRLREDIILPTKRMLDQRKKSVGLEIEEVEEDGEGDIVAFVDRLRLQQVITNLIVNSMKYTAVGFIRVKMRKLRRWEVGGDHLQCATGEKEKIQGNEASVNEELPGNDGISCPPATEEDPNDVAGILISVSDSGSGIDPSNYPNLFERWEKLGSRTNGTGIGLCLCRSLMEVMGGRIFLSKVYDSGIENHPGCQFNIQLPFSVLKYVEEEGGRGPLHKTSPKRNSRMAQGVGGGSRDAISGNGTSGLCDDALANKILRDNTKAITVADASAKNAPDISPSLSSVGNNEITCVADSPTPTLSNSSSLEFSQAERIRAADDVGKGEKNEMSLQAKSAHILSLTTSKELPTKNQPDDRNSKVSECLGKDEKTIAPTQVTNRGNQPTKASPNSAKKTHPQHPPPKQAPTTSQPSETTPPTPPPTPSQNDSLFQNACLHGPFRILVVDDDATFRKIFSRRLHRILPHATIDQSPSGEDSLIKTTKHTYDLITMDHFMALNEMNGAETIQALRKKHVDACIVGISGNTKTTHHLEAGADDFVRKPVPHDSRLLKRLVGKMSPPAGWKVLIADDCKLNLKFIHRKLIKVCSPHFTQKNVAEKRWDFTLKTNGEDSVESLKKEWFDLVVLDQHMGPGLKGTDVAEILRREGRNKNAIVVINSASALQTITEASGAGELKNGDVSPVAQPFNFHWMKPAPSVERIQQDLCLELICERSPPNTSRGARPKQEQVKFSSQDSAKERRVPPVPLTHDQEEKKASSSGQKKVDDGVVGGNNTPLSQESMVLQKLYNEIGDEATLHEMCKLFISTVPLHMDNIDKHISDQNLQALAIILHTLRGTLQVFHLDWESVLKPMHKLCLDLQQREQQQSKDTIELRNDVNGEEIDQLKRYARMQREALESVVSVCRNVLLTSNKDDAD